MFTKSFLARKRFTTDEALEFVDSDALEEFGSDEIEDSRSLDGDSEVAS